MKEKRLTLISLLSSMPYLTILAIISLFMRTFSNIKIRECSGGLTDLFIYDKEFIGILFKIIGFLLSIVCFTLINNYIVKKICRFISRDIVAKMLYNLNKKNKNDIFSFFLKDIVDVEKYINDIFTVIFFDVFFFFIAFIFIYRINSMLSIVILLSVIIFVFISVNLNIRLKGSLGKDINKLNFTLPILRFFLTVLLTSIYGVILLKNSDITLGSLLVFFLLINCIVNPVTRINKIIDIIKRGQISLSKLNKDILLSEGKKEEFNTIGTKEETVIEFKNVSYYCQDDELKNLSFKVKDGQLSLITGSIASKRSYIIKLIIGVITPNEGEILLYNKPLSNYNFEYLYSKVAVISKRTVLFSGTIYDNILIANPKATKSDVEQACKSAGIHEEILKYKSGYSTEIGENGYGITEKMREDLSIARAFLKDAPIILLDEPYDIVRADKTDNFNKRLNKLCKDKTIIMIVQNIDNINENKHVA